MPVKRKAARPQHECASCSELFHDKIAFKALDGKSTRAIKNRLCGSSVVFALPPRICICPVCLVTTILDDRTVHVYSYFWAYSKKQTLMDIVTVIGLGIVQRMKTKLVIAKRQNVGIAQAERAYIKYKASFDMREAWLSRRFDIAFVSNTERCICHKALATRIDSLFGTFQHGQHEGCKICLQCLAIVKNDDTAEHHCTIQRKKNDYFRPRVTRLLPATYRPPRNYQITDKMAKEFFQDICTDSDGLIKCPHCLAPVFRTEACKNVYCVCGKSCCFNCGNARGGYACEYGVCFSDAYGQLWQDGELKSFEGERCDPSCQSHQKDCTLQRHAAWRKAQADSRRATRAYAFVKSLRHRPHLYRRLRRMYLQKKILASVRPPPPALALASEAV